MATAGYGALAGLGAGLAQVGAGMSSAADREDLLSRQEASRARLQDDAQAARLEATVARATGGRGAAPSLGALEIAADPEKLALLSGLSREEANDYVAMAKGRNPGETVEMSPSRFTSADRAADAMDDPTSQRVEKYTPGEGRALRERASMALREAMKVANPGQADNLAKAQRDDQVRGLVDKAVGGDVAAAEGALLAQGKDPAVGEAAGARADAAMEAAKRKGSGGGSGGVSGPNKVQKTFTDASGFVNVVFKDGSTKNLGIQASDFGKRVDAVASKLAKTIEFMGKPADEVRAAAERQLAGGAAPAAAPAASRPPLSSFKK